MRRFAGNPRYETREVAPSRIADMVRAEVARGTQRVLVCGGDDTIATAVGAAAGTPLEVAVLPGGTLKHCARVVTTVRGA